MRKNRCRKCNKPFYSADPKVTECQNCTGDQPDTEVKYKTETTAKKKANARTKADKSQTVSIKTLQKPVEDDDASAG